MTLLTLGNKFVLHLIRIAEISNNYSCPKSGTSHFGKLQIENLVHILDWDSFCFDVDVFFLFFTFCIFFFYLNKSNE